MFKLLFILLIGLVFESTGVVLLKKGMSQLGGMNAASVSEIARVIKSGATHPQILLGVFFACLLLLMARSDISFLWPVTALSFVFATLAAMWFLGEQVSAIRWIGVVLIMAGAALISYSEHAKPAPSVPAATAIAPASVK
jgi:uncharacterized membrane protein